MVEKDIQTSILLELAFCVTGEIEEHLILKKSIPFYLRKLNCFLAGVIKVQDDIWEESILIPFVASKSDEWNAVKAYFSNQSSNDDDPCTQLILAESYYYSYNLNSYGILILGRKNPFEYTLKNELKPIVNQLGKFLIQAKEVEQRKKAEESLRESEQRLRTLSDTTTAGIFIYHNQVFIYANPAAENLTGYSCQELYNLSFQELIHPDFLSVIRNKVQNNPSSRESHAHLEIKIIQKKGEERWMDLTVGVIEWMGVNAGIISAFDITNQKRYEEELRESQQIIEGIINTIPVRIFWKDKNLNYLGCNPAFAKDAGFSDSKEIIGKNDYQLSWYGQAELYRADDNHVIESGNPKFNIEEPQTSLENYSISLLTSKMPLRNSKGDIIGMLGAYMDITEMKRAKEELIQAKEKAIESDRLKSAFLANMSHEIRTPMNGILGFAELLKEPGLSGEDQMNYLTMIEEGGERMLNIINNLIDISKLESGMTKITSTETNINLQLDYIYSFFKPEVEKKGMQLFLKSNLNDKESIVCTDKEKIYAILINLVKNAIKYSEKGFIELGVSTGLSTGAVCELVEPVELQFYVKDTGFGIPKDRQFAVFERFIQSDIENRQAIQGAGLGLSISKGYVEMLGGKMWMESELGHGSTFYFTIPCKSNSLD